MFASDEELLTETTVEAFGHMRIHADVQMSIQRRIFKYMCNNRASVESLKLWPTYTKFILNSSYENADALLMVIFVTIITTTIYIFFSVSFNKVVNDLRNCLQWNQSADCGAPTVSDRDISQLAVFECIVRSLKSSQKLFENWLKVIKNVLTDDTKPIDLLVLLIMMSINDERTNQIDNIVSRHLVYS